MRRNRERNRATTVFWSACDWLCCASNNGQQQRAADSADNLARNRSRSSCHSVYEVVNDTNANTTIVDPVVHTTVESRSPTLSSKNSRKISPVMQPRLGVDHAVLRQKFDAMANNRKLTVLSTTQSEDLELCRTYFVNRNGISATSPSSLKCSSAGSYELRKTSQPCDTRNSRLVQHKFSLVEQRSKPPVALSPRDTQSLPSSRSFSSPTYGLQSYVKTENSCPMEQLEEETVEPDTVDVLRKFTRLI
ncbi:unnamed protein product [Bursaphelenchus okinawaensis]|uniref:Uncharacterized protein n=1 Tax=Bursaphelenchus okinawaensis TaxID=465554 RepID=A0A811KJH0_9BILA|nr:unnamed protein product [Bursaphelenchus okinawaensis]CAG9103776.1 unnamed protein product [Bursaphelenchus okinawaensis]